MNSLSRIKFWLALCLALVGLSGQAFPVLSTGFDPNHVIADAVFLDADAMSDSEIQVFLENHGPGGVASFLATYQVGGRSTAEVIGSAARAAGINPRIILVKLQVEKSLIGKYSPANPPPQSTLDYAMGYACPDGRPCDPAFAGFDKQISAAANRFRQLFDGGYKGYWEGPGHPYHVGEGTDVYPVNVFTGVLYIYIPWIGSYPVPASGNKAFWGIWIYYGFGDPTEPTLPADDARLAEPVWPAIALPGEGFQVTITLRNEGTATWQNEAGYALVNASNPMGVPERLPLPHDVLPGETATWILNLTAPKTPGLHQSWWQLRHGDEPVGERITVWVGVLPEKAREWKAELDRLIEEAKQKWEEARQRGEEEFERFVQELIAQLQRELARIIEEQSQALWEAFLRWLQETCTGALLPVGALALAGMWLGRRRR